MDSAVQVHALRRFCSRPNGPNSAQPSRWDGLIGDEYSFCEDSSGESSAKDEDFEFVVFYQQKVAAQKLKSNWLFIHLPCQFAQFESRVSLLPCKNFFFFPGSRLSTAVGPTDLCSIFDTVGGGCSNLHPPKLRIFLRSFKERNILLWDCRLKVSALRCRPQTRNPPVQMDTAQGQGKPVCHHRGRWRSVFSNIFVQFQWRRLACTYTQTLYTSYEFIVYL